MENGIPKNIVDKIFPAFLHHKTNRTRNRIGIESWSYDIKAHGGEIKVETKQKEGTTFFIQLPIV